MGVECFYDFNYSRCFCFLVPCCQQVV